MNTLVTELNCQDAPTQAKRLAQTIATTMQTIIASQGNVVLAVSGGRSPVDFFEALSVIDLPWEKVTISLVDERIIDTAHADSNTRLVREHLLINKAHAATFHGLLDDNLCASDLTDIERLTQQANQHFIQPDLIVLGMGEDAHTASLFPLVADLAAAASVINVVPQTAPYPRLSLSLQTILSARAIYLAVGGETKMPVYRQAKQQKTPEQPVSYVLHQNKTAVTVIYYE